MCHAVVMLITSYNQPDFPPPHMHLRNGVQEGEEEPGWFRQVSTPEKDSQVIIILLELLELLESKYSVTVPAPGFSML